MKNKNHNGNKNIKSLPKSTSRPKSKSKSKEKSHKFNPLQYLNALIELTNNTNVLKGKHKKSTQKRDLSSALTMATPAMEQTISTSKIRCKSSYSQYRKKSTTHNNNNLKQIINVEFNNYIITEEQDSTNCIKFTSISSANNSHNQSPISKNNNVALFKKQPILLNKDKDKEYGNSNLMKDLNMYATRIQRAWRSYQTYQMIRKYYKKFKKQKKSIRNNEQYQQKQKQRQRKSQYAPRNYHFPQSYGNNNRSSGSKQQQFPSYQPYINNYLGDNHHNDEDGLLNLITIGRDSNNSIDGQNVLQKTIKFKIKSHPEPLSQSEINEQRQNEKQQRVRRLNSSSSSLQQSNQQLNLTQRLNKIRQFIQNQSVSQSKNQLSSIIDQVPTIQIKKNKKIISNNNNNSLRHNNKQKEQKIQSFAQQQKQPYQQHQQQVDDQTSTQKKKNKIKNLLYYSNNHNDKIHENQQKLRITKNTQINKNINSSKNKNNKPSTSSLLALCQSKESNNMITKRQQQKTQISLVDNMIKKQTQKYNQILSLIQSNCYKQSNHTNNNNNNNCNNSNNNKKTEFILSELLNRLQKHKQQLLINNYNNNHNHKQQSTTGIRKDKNLYKKKDSQQQIIKKQQNNKQLEIRQQQQIDRLRRYYDLLTNQTHKLQHILNANHQNNSNILSKGLKQQQQSSQTQQLLLQDNNYTIEDYKEKQCLNINTCKHNQQGQQLQQQQQRYQQSSSIYESSSSKQSQSSIQKSYQYSQQSFNQDSINKMFNQHIKIIKLKHQQSLSNLSQLINSNQLSLSSYQSKLKQIHQSYQHKNHHILLNKHKYLSNIKSIHKQALLFQKDLITLTNKSQSKQSKQKNYQNLSNINNINKNTIKALKVFTILQTSKNQSYQKNSNLELRRSLSGSLRRSFSAQNIVLKCILKQPIIQNNQFIINNYLIKNQQINDITPINQYGVQNNGHNQKQNIIITHQLEHHQKQQQSQVSAQQQQQQQNQVLIDQQQQHNRNRQIKQLPHQKKQQVIVLSNDKYGKQKYSDDSQLLVEYDQQQQNGIYQQYVKDEQDAQLQNKLQQQLYLQYNKSQQSQQQQNRSQNQQQQNRQQNQQQQGIPQNKQQQNKTQKLLPLPPQGINQEQQNYQQSNNPTIINNKNNFDSKIIVISHLQQSSQLSQQLQYQQSQQQYQQSQQQQLQLFQSSSKQLNYNHTKQLNYDHHSIPNELKQQYSQEIQQMIYKQLITQFIQQVYLNDHLIQLFKPYIQQIYSFTQITDSDIIRFAQQQLTKYFPQYQQLIIKANQKINPTSIQILKLVRDYQFQIDQYQLILDQHVFKSARKSIQLQYQQKINQKKQIINNTIHSLSSSIEGQNNNSLLYTKQILQKIHQRQKIKSNKITKYMQYQRDMKIMYMKAVFNCLNQFLIQQKSIATHVNTRTTISIGQLSMSIKQFNTQFNKQQTQQLFTKSYSRIIKILKHKCMLPVFKNYKQVSLFQQQMLKIIKYQFQQTQYKWVTYMDQVLQIWNQIANQIIIDLLKQTVNQIVSFQIKNHHHNKQIY